MGTQVQGYLGEELAAAQLSEQLSARLDNW